MSFKTVIIYHLGGGGLLFSKPINVSQYLLIFICQAIEFCKIRSDDSYLKKIKIKHLLQWKFDF